MKELSIEDKAKAYDEAIEKAKAWCDCEYATTDDKILLKRILPELKESEGDQHRKWILEYLYDGLQKSDEQFKGQFKCAIAWLEKQGDSNKEYWRGYREGKKEILDKYSELEKQGEQNPAWSEEDEKVIDVVESWLDVLCSYLKNNSSQYIPVVKKVISKLKSLRPQKQWKPTEEQIKALGAARHCAHFDVHILDSLFHDLEQLKQL